MNSIELLFIYQNRQISSRYALYSYSEPTIANIYYKDSYSYGSYLCVVKLQQPYYEQSRHRKLKDYSHYYSIEYVTNEWMDIHVTTRVGHARYHYSLTITCTLSSVSSYYKLEMHLSKEKRSVHQFYRISYHLRDNPSIGSI